MIMGMSEDLRFGLGVGIVIGMILMFLFIRYKEHQLSKKAEE